MSGLFSELKRRNVFRVAAAYLVIGWLLLQVVDTVVPALHMPAWIISAITLVLILAFIPVVLFSWAYELTPDGLKKDSAVDKSKSVSSQTAKKLDVITLIAVVGVASLFVYQQIFPVSHNQSEMSGKPTKIQGSTQDVAAKSIAVLPFADMSIEGDQAYFADGISEELLNVLAQVDGLKVAARTSSFKFRGDEHDIVEIGSALNVRTVLEGSVRKSGNQVRITAQLIDVAGGFHVWSETYDRELDNIFAVQDEIASAIVEALKLKLKLNSQVGGSQHAENGEAYDLYLRGRELAREPSKSGLTRAIQYFEQALVIDPDFAAAHGAIASAWIWLEDYGGIPSQDAFDRAEPAARRALELEPNRADALTAMGFLEERKYTNDEVARDYFERAIKANPAFIEAYTLYADALRDLGEIELALKVRRDAVERDPLSGFLQSRLASMMVGLGRYDEAQQIIDAILLTAPNDTYAYEELGNLLVTQGRLAEAIPAYTFLHENRPGDPFAAAQIAISYKLMQMSDQQQQWLAAARDRGAGNRWELSARRSIAQWSGDWDAMFRVGQLYLAKTGTTWQGQASLGQLDWEAARSAFQRTLSRLNYRQGDLANGNVLEALVGLALAEKRLEIDSWTVHANAARVFAENKLVSISLGNWPNINLNYTLAQLAAVDGDVEGVVKYMQGALDEHIIEYSFIKHDPFFIEFRDEARLIAIAQQMEAHALAEAGKLEPTP
ncbi:tetratricopeptide repeat protein [Marinicella litoralis]|uniref:TolB-like protein n=1 Tax=Marinicella litoralis TaxID=644220 RepID=A0A4R6XR53_9GAMM|nr:tetratricopeptide repeat protein [Marinicella litoralis]TDR22355.1 TolB-like protein [Marinicella litoralis]